MNIGAIVLGAGKGTRMGDVNGSPIPKVMFELAGKPIIDSSVNNLKLAGIEQVVVVVGYKKEMVMDYLKNRVEYAFQEEQLGTGHAVMMAEKKVAGNFEAVLVSYGDMPLFKPETIKKLIDAYNQEKPTIAMLSVEFDNPEFWVYGRLIRNDKGEVIKSIEQKDCTPEEVKIKDCNPCFYIFNNAWLWENLRELKTENAQKEYYLTDLIGMATSQGKRIITVPVSEHLEALGINTQEQLRQAEEVLSKRK
jgi:bifunctional UDP-N-acetylglucosamine pyrophosphorylase/glucosamine-1-phosphate N-acetyltransferase